MSSLQAFWDLLGERYRELPGPWWAVFAIYEVLLIGAWLLEYMLLRRIRTLSGDPIEARDRDRSYTPWWLLHFLLLQFPLFRTGRWATIFPQVWTTTYIGTFVAASGMLLRLYSIYCLRENFSYVVYVGKQHRLVTTGLYRYIRHPAYLGLIIFFVGIPVVVCDSWSVLVAMTYVGTMVAFRIRDEERSLRELFGEQFEEWRGRTKLLVPFVL